MAPLDALISPHKWQSAKSYPSHLGDQRKERYQQLRSTEKVTLQNCCCKFFDMFELDLSFSLDLNIYKLIILKNFTT